MQLWYIFHNPFQIIIPRSEFFSYLFLFQPDKKFDVVSLFFNERAYSLVFYSKCYLRSLNICLFVLKSQNFWKEAVSIKPCFIRFSFNFLQITCRFFVVYMPYSFCQNTCTQRYRCRPSFLPLSTLLSKHQVLGKNEACSVL